MKEETVYDMDKDEWRNHKHEDNDTWRSSKKYACPVCRALSDRWVFKMVYWGPGPRIKCPVFEKSPDVHNQVVELEVDIKNTKEPKQKAILRKKVKELRNKLDKIKKDIESS